MSEPRVGVVGYGVIGQRLADGVAPLSRTDLDGGRRDLGSRCTASQCARATPRKGCFLT